jgi:hypothetical protein
MALLDVFNIDINIYIHRWLRLHAPALIREGSAASSSKADKFGAVFNRINSHLESTGDSCVSIF